MLYTEGAMWKRARTLFNPGFAIGHLMTLVPGIVEDTLSFRQILSKHSDSGEILQIEPAARLLAIDVWVALFSIILSIHWVPRMNWRQRSSML
jgi:hypothetical protein